MDFGKAFTYMFQDSNWLAKLGIGTLLVLVGIFLVPVLIGFVPLIIVTGYSLVALDNVRLGHEHPLPEWQDWGKFFMLGLKASVALFIWALPMFIGFVPVLAGSVLSGDSNSNGAGAIAALLIICGSCLMFLWGLFVALLTPAIYARLAATDRFASAFDLGRIWEFTRDNLGNVIIAILLVWLAGLIAAVLGSLGFLLLCIGAMLTIPLASLWQYLVQAHLFGQIAANSVTSIE
jgi:Protein of unknown function (DUF4013)